MTSCFGMRQSKNFGKGMRSVQKFFCVGKSEQIIEKDGIGENQAPGIVGRSEQILELHGIGENEAPVTAEQIQEYIDSGRLHKASQCLIVMEREGYKSTNDTSTEEITRKQEKVASLYNNLGKALSEILQKSIEMLSNQSVENKSKGIALLTEAVKAITEQVNEDEKCTLGSAVTRARSKRWKKCWEKLVEQSVNQRMKELPETTSDTDRSSFAKQLECLGKTMKSDLIVVVNDLKMIYPQNFEVCNVYARCYHEYFSLHLTTVTDFEFADQDNRCLLMWIHCIYPNTIMQDPDLCHSVTWKNMEPLLPPEKIAELEQQYVSHVEGMVEQRMNSCLDVEVKFWTEGKKPPILNGVSHSELSIDTIQVMNGEIEGAERVAVQLANQLLPLLVEKLAEFLKRYKKTFAEFMESNKKHKYYQAIVIANINNCDDYRDYIKILESRHLAEEDKMRVVAILSEIEQIGFDMLLQELTLQLQPHLKTLSQKNGLFSHGTMIEMIKVSEAYFEKLKTLKSCYYQEMVEKIHIYLVKEYITRLLKKKVSQKSPEQQRTIAKQIFENGSLIKNCCMSHGSQAKWLNHAIPTLAEIVKLQEIDAIKIVVASLSAQYPDISKNQVAAALYIKGNLKNGDVKSIVNILDIREPEEDSPKLFSEIMIS